MENITDSDSDVDKTYKSYYDKYYQDRRKKTGINTGLAYESFYDQYWKKKNDMYIHGATSELQHEAYSSSKTVRHLYSLSTKGDIFDHGVDPEYSGIIIKYNETEDFKVRKLSTEYEDFVLKITPFIPLLNCIAMQPLPLYTNFGNYSEFSVNFPKYIDIMDFYTEGCGEPLHGEEYNKPNEIRQLAVDMVVSKIITTDKNRFVGFNKTKPVTPTGTYLYRYMYNKTIDNIDRIILVKNSEPFNSKKELEDIAKVMTTEANTQPIYYGANDCCYDYFRIYEFDGDSILDVNDINDQSQLFKLYILLTRSENYYPFYNNPKIDITIYALGPYINNLKNKDLTKDEIFWLYRLIKNVAKIDEVYESLVKFNSFLSDLIDNKIMFITEVEKSLIIELAYYLSLKNKITGQKNINYIKNLADRAGAIDVNHQSCIYNYSD
jgi:hypothetical protein